jgi:hypothetical protein
MPILDFSGAPGRIRGLPLDARGYPVPYFVHWENGVPDFRVIAAGKVAECVIRKRCWICGEGLGRFMAFTIGPMCAINRISGEPPAHRDCSEFAARNCPFLVNPQMKRISGEQRPFAGKTGELKMSEFHDPRNPQAALVWITQGYQTIQPNKTECLFVMGDPTEVLWFKRGVPATRMEALEAISLAYPILREAALKEAGPKYADEITQQFHAATKLLPKL